MTEKNTDQHLSRTTIFLTPECHKLWLIRPGILLLYDKVILDKRDYDEIFKRQYTSTYNYLICRNLELLNKEGLIELINYEKILSKERRRNIYTTTQKFIAELPDEELLALSLHAYKEYENFLKNKITFCRLGEPKYKDMLEQLKKVQKEVNLLNTKRKVDMKHVEALKRLTAKIIAGITVLSKYGSGILHDTNEYKPFFEKYKSAKSIDNLLFVEKNENLGVRMVISCIFDKLYPEVDVYDEKSFYEFIMIRKDFATLKKIILQINELFGELLDTDTELVFKELKKEICSTLNAYDRELNKLQSKFFRKILWGSFEKIGSKYIPLFKIFIDPLKRKNDNLLKKEVEKRLINKGSLDSNLYLLYIKMKSNQPKFELPILQSYDHREYSGAWTWGENNLILPWYEKP